MKYTTAVLTLLMLLLAGSIVWAQCPAPCPVATPVQVECPAPCPAQCPAPQQACPAPCPACPASVPAAVGAGPAGDLEGLACPQFDPAYAQKMYEQNSVIIAVTQYGQQRATDKNLRSISGEINRYMTSANEKLAGWYGNCAALGTDCPRAQAIINELSQQCGDCFDVAYAKTLSTLLKQSQCAEGLGEAKASAGSMQQQAAFLAEKNADWSFRLDRWVTDHGY